MKSFTRFATLLVLFWLMLFLNGISADVDETTISATFNQLPGSSGWGGSFETPYETGIVSGNATVTAQGGDGDIRGKYHIEGGVTWKAIDLILYTDGVFKGPEVASLGRQSDLGFAIEAPDEVAGDSKFSYGIGIFGRNGGKYASPNALGELERLGYDVEALAGLGLESTNPAPQGLSIPVRNSVNSLLYAQYSHSKGFGLELRVMPELFGSGDDGSVHSGVITARTSFELGEQLSLEIKADYGIQLIDDVVEKELATLAAIKYTF